MSPENTLPILLVSAVDKVTAEAFISELIDNDVTEEVGAEADGARVWRLVNKYYRADVSVRPLAHGAPLPAADAPRLEAHVIYFTSQECLEAESGESGESGESASVQAVQVAQARAAVGAACRGVRVAALRAAREGALGAWAGGARYEPLALGGAPGPAPAAALQRARAALHAHVWPGLRRLDRPSCPLPLPLPMPIDVEWSSSEGSGAEDGEDGEEEEALGVERAEEFARALGALEGVGGAGAGAGGALSDGERRARAEQLLAAFCRALGHDLQL